MVRILNNTEEDALIGSIGTFYSLSDCSRICGNGIIINFSEKFGKVTYSDLRFTTFDKKEFQLYYRKEKLLIDVTLELLREFQEIYVFNYGDKWITDKKIAPSLNKILKDNKVFDGDSRVLQLTEESEVVAFVKSILRYNTFVSFFDSEKGIVITPTDHLDIFIDSKDDYVNTVREIIENERTIFCFTQKNID